MARCESQVKVARRVAKNFRDEIVNRVIRNEVIVIERKDVGSFYGIEVVDERAGQHRLAWQGDGAKQRFGFLHSAWEALLNGSDDILEEYAQVVVALVERNPDRWPADLFQPGAEQGGLAVAGGASDEDKRHIAFGGQIVQQALAGQVIRRERWPVHLGPD